MKTKTKNFNSLLRQQRMNGLLNGKPSSDLWYMLQTMCIWQAMEWFKNKHHKWLGIYHLTVFATCENLIGLVHNCELSRAHAQLSVKYLEGTADDTDMQITLHYLQGDFGQLAKDFTKEMLDIAYLLILKYSIEGMRTQPLLALYPQLLDKMTLSSTQEITQLDKSETKESFEMITSYLFLFYSQGDEAPPEKFTLAWARENKQKLRGSYQALQELHSIAVNSIGNKMSFLGLDVLMEKRTNDQIRFKEVVSRQLNVSNGETQAS